MTRELVAPDEMLHLVERFNYAPAVKVGNLIYCAGQVGRDANMKVIDSSLEDHFVAAFENLGAVLRAAGSDFEHIVEMTTFHVGLQDHLPLFLEVRERFIPRGPVPHAWSAIGVTELTFPGQLVELKAIALVP
ncbi:RidA family protein [Microbacterium sp. zg.Y1090]|uniref:RidA family protein n=1 Tax=Microbacterium TaxID=33882 RepID=UPI00214BD57A|nr:MULTISPECIES: RidA family protein [unclassified Microbacterium]MCR2811518.1 RidA family protein [Microbacterium sp. zg.Y1084]MCR2819064.1 RidA family protein [Microbacterium sp. zg.Y1090]MDL5487710.1 RidA family protein [Microbacterium sp. zg-Y1211]WIM27367.1 RidA family protein [Microbacterium sp. zg-Y1090]